jgi:hydroxymethylpyrimidine/phosphomethylpyrimidine kinase
VDPLVVLTIAGSDSSGGAGIEADLRTFASLGVHGAVALTAITAQNTRGVFAVLPVEPEMVRAQVVAVADDLAVAATKTGMLARPATVRAVAQLAAEGRLPRLVVDPVLVASTGHLLMEDGGVDAYRDALFAHATVVTPNLREAAVLVGVDVSSLRTVEAMASAAGSIQSMGPACVVVKGGHQLDGSATADLAPDVVVTENGSVTLSGPRIATRNDHGTGCSLASAIAVGLAEGLAPLAAVRRAKSFVAVAIAGAATWHLGEGHGPIDHLGWGRTSHEPERSDDVAAGLASQPNAAAPGPA